MRERDMAKKTKSKARKQRQAEAQKVEAAQPMGRRDVLRLGGFAALGLLAAGGATYAGVGAYRAYKFEHDLTRIGQGKPAVVQVHDPQCSVCLALQSETRRAMRQFGE